MLGRTLFYLFRIPLKPVFSLGLVLLLFSACHTNISYQNVRDYSSLLPEDQLLYVTLNVQPKWESAGFPYHSLFRVLIQDTDFREAIKSRLVRSQLAFGSENSIYTINQLSLNEQLFSYQMKYGSDWVAVEGLSNAFHRMEQTVYMPQNNTLYFEISSKYSPSWSQFLGKWKKHSTDHTPGDSTVVSSKFMRLQEKSPLVLYTNHVTELLGKISSRRLLLYTLEQFQENELIESLLLWVELVEKNGVHEYIVNLELDTLSSATRGIYFVLKMILPSLLMQTEKGSKVNMEDFRMNMREEFIHIRIPCYTSLIEAIFLLFPTPGV